MSEADLQELLDGVATEIGAAVVLEDDDFRLLAHTDHGEVIDAVRQSSIIGRRATAEVRAWFEQWGIRTAVKPMRTPANESMGALARWCVPVRFRGTLLGYVWVLTNDGLSQSALDPAIEAAEEIAPILNRRRMLAQTDSDLLRLLLVPRPDVEHRQLAAEARALGYDTHQGPFTVIAVSDLAHETLGSATLSDLTMAARRATRQSYSEAALSGALSGLAVVLAPVSERTDLGSARQLAGRIRHNAIRLDAELQPIVAIGDATDLGRISDSFAAARRTLRMMRALPDLQPIAAWDELGIFRALALLPPEELHHGVLDPRVQKLLENEELAATAETFLDLTGSVQRTAEALYLHRATLYQRLDRIATLFDLDLRHNGHHRLLVHLSLKLARIAPA